MAIFNKETEFYTHTAPPPELDQSLLYKFIDLVVDNVFVLNIVASILVYILTQQWRSGNGIEIAAGAMSVYIGLIGTPAIIAALIASPALLSWRRYKQHLFKRIFEIVFVFLYLLLLLSVSVIQLTTGAIWK